MAGGEVLDRGKVERTLGHVIYWWEGEEEGGWREKEEVDSCTRWPVLAVPGLPHPLCDFTPGLHLSVLTLFSNL